MMDGELEMCVRVCACVRVANRFCAFHRDSFRDLYLCVRHPLYCV